MKAANFLRERARSSISFFRLVEMLCSSEKVVKDALGKRERAAAAAAERGGMYIYSEQVNERLLIVECVCVCVRYTAEPRIIYSVLFLFFKFKNE